MPDLSELTHISSRLGFTLAELELNRGGQLSSAQSWAAYRNAIFGLGVMLSAIGIVMIVVGVKSSGMLRWAWYLFLVPAAAAVLWIGGMEFVGSIRQRILTAEGALQFRGVPRAPPRLVIGKASVESPGGAREVLVVGKAYRLYYLAGIDQFLSIEPL